MVILDESRQIVVIDGKERYFPPKERRILAAFAKADGRCLSREEITRIVYRANEIHPATDSRTIDQHIARLRRGLGKWRHVIVTVTEDGYRATEELQLADIPLTHHGRILDVQHQRGTRPKTICRVTFDGIRDTIKKGGTVRTV